MAITERATGTGGETPTGSPVTCTLTASPVADDLILVFVTFNNSTENSHAVASITGFTSLGISTAGGWSRTRCLGKIAAGTEGTSLSVTWTGTADAVQCGALVLTGADTTLPTNVVTTPDASSNTTFSIPAITNAAANSLDVACVGHGGNVDPTAAPNYSTWGDSFNERVDAATPWAALGIASVIRASSGVQAATSVTSAASDVNAAIRIEVLEAATGDGDLTLQSIAAVSSLANMVVAAPATIALGTIAAVAALNNMVVATPANLALDAIAAVSSLNNMAVAAPATIALDQIAAVSALPNVAVAAPATIVLDPIAAVSNLPNMALASPITIALDPIAAVSNLPNMAVASPITIALDPIAAVAALNNITITTDADIPGAVDSFMLFKVAAGQGRS